MDARRRTTFSWLLQLFATRVGDTTILAAVRERSPASAAALACTCRTAREAVAAHAREAERQRRDARLHLTVPVTSATLTSAAGQLPPAVDELRLTLSSGPATGAPVDPLRWLLSTATPPPANPFWDKIGRLRDLALDMRELCAPSPSLSPGSDAATVDLSPLSVLADLRRLSLLADLRSDGPVGISALTMLTSLAVSTIACPPAASMWRELSALSGGLRELRLFGEGQFDLEALATLTSLRSLHLTGAANASYADVGTLSRLSGLASLRALELHRHQHRQQEDQEPDAAARLGRGGVAALTQLRSLSLRNDPGLGRIGSALVWNELLTSLELTGAAACCAEARETVRCEAPALARLSTDQPVVLPPGALHALTSLTAVVVGPDMQQYLVRELSKPGRFAALVRLSLSAGSSDPSQFLDQHLFEALVLRLPALRQVRLPWLCARAAECDVAGWEGLEGSAEHWDRLELTDHGIMTFEDWVFVRYVLSRSKPDVLALDEAAPVSLAVDQDFLVDADPDDEDEVADQQLRTDAIEMLAGAGVRELSVDLSWCETWRDARVDGHAAGHVVPFIERLAPFNRSLKKLVVTGTLNRGDLAALATAFSDVRNVELARCHLVVADPGDPAARTRALEPLTKSGRRRVTLDEHCRFSGSVHTWGHRVRIDPA